MEIITGILAWLEQHLAWALLIVFTAANILVLAVHLAGKYVREHGLPPGPFKDKLDKIIYEIDRVCDNMENPTKRSMAMIQLQQVLGWKRVFLPSAIIGWIIDTEVAFIRKIQQVTGTPDMHQEGGQTNGQSNA